MMRISNILNIVKYDINDHRILYHNCALFNLKILNLVPLRYLHMLYDLYMRL